MGIYECMMDVNTYVTHMYISVYVCMNVCVYMFAYIVY